VDDADGGLQVLEAVAIVAITVAGRGEEVRFLVCLHVVVVVTDGRRRCCRSRVHLVIF